MLFLVLLLTGPVAQASEDKPKPQGSWQQTVKALESAEVLNDCGRLWQLLWPWAKEGRAEANLALAELVRWNHLTPDGTGKDALARLRLSAGLFKAAAQAGNHQAMLALSDFYGGELFGQPANQELALCWQMAARDKKQLHECQLLDSEYAVIPTMSILSAEITLLNSSSNSAQCLVPNNDTPQAAITD